MSNSLTLGLALLGGVVLTGVVAHGAWTARKTAARAPKRAEPTDSALAQGDAAGALLDTQPMDTVSLSAQPAIKRSTVRLDALIDAIATITLEHPITGDAVLAHMPPTRRAGSKPVLIEALRTDCGEWEAPQPGVTYSELQAGVLLANRTGGLNEIEYSEFVHKIQSMVDGLGGAAAEFPDMLDVVGRAKELDAFASAHDAQLAMRLHAKGSAWSVGYVQQQASRHGFVAGALPGRMVLPSLDDGAPPVLTLHFDAQAAFAEDPDQATLRELLLAFDVPQTATDVEPYKAWCAAGEALSLAMGAVMADEQGRAFTSAAFESIGVELTRLYAALGSRDLAAGSAAARRLFA